MSLYIALGACHVEISHLIPQEIPRLFTNLSLTLGIQKNCTASEIYSIWNICL